MQNEPDTTSGHQLSFNLKDLLTPGSGEAIPENITNDFFVRLLQTDIVRRLINEDNRTFSVVNPEIIHNISAKTGLHFANADDDIINKNASSVCYAESTEVRDEFKTELPPQTFNEVDVLDYACGVFISLSEKDETDLHNILYPASQYAFWKKVQKGKAFRESLQ